MTASPSDYRWLWTWLLAMLLAPITVAAQEIQPDPYAGLSDADAKSKFERTAVALRGQQREALRIARDELSQLAESQDVDSTSRRANQRLGDQVADLNDLSMALEIMLRERRSLNAALHPSFDAIVERLQEHWRAYQECKLQYQRSAGQSLARRWKGMSIEQKRCELADYLALADERPSWLLRSSPINVKELVPKNIQPPIDQYIGEMNDEVQRARAELKPALDELCELSRRLANDQSLTEEQRFDAAGIAETIEAPYGRGLNGVLLCLPSQSLPEKLRIEVQHLLKNTLTKLDRLRPNHARLLSELNTRLESNENMLLNQAKFAEQMAIDLYLDTVTRLVQPMRVFANRTPTAPYLEDARLLEVKSAGEKFRYRVEFLVDGVTRWVDCDQIVTRPSAKWNGPARNNVPVSVPVNGPGQVVNDTTDLYLGQIYAYGHSGWKPANVIDESGLGVIIRWHGRAEPIDFYFQRHELRIVK